MDAPSEEELAFARRPERRASLAGSGSPPSDTSETARLRGQMAQLRAENEALRRQAFEALSDSEKSQEQISNRLIRQIDQMRRERAELLTAVEAEEEYLTNNFQRRLGELQRQKEELRDNEREAEIDRLLSQLKRMGGSDSAVLNALEAELSLIKSKFVQKESERNKYFLPFCSAGFGAVAAAREPAAAAGEHEALAARAPELDGLAAEQCRPGQRPLPPHHAALAAKLSSPAAGGLWPVCLPGKHQRQQQRYQCDDRSQERLNCGSAAAFRLLVHLILPPNHIFLHAILPSNHIFNHIFNHILSRGPAPDLFG